MVILSQIHVILSKAKDLCQLNQAMAWRDASRCSA